MLFWQTWTTAVKYFILAMQTGMHICTQVSVLYFQRWPSACSHCAKVFATFLNQEFVAFGTVLAEKTKTGKAYPVERSHTKLCSKEWNSCIIWFQTYTFLQDFNSSSRLLKTFSTEITKSISMFHRQKTPISIIYFIFPMWRRH